MDLLLGQLIYTSFTGLGFRKLASKQVPQKVQQAFSEQIISVYWNTSSTPNQDYRAVYLYQVTPHQTLFGWLYHDGIDELTGNSIPYFICYYLAETLLEFHLETIFTCLQTGPLALIDRHNPPFYLPTKTVSSLCNYQSVRPGVPIFIDEQAERNTLNEGKLLNIFVPVAAQETVVIRNRQSYEQQIASLSIYHRYILEEIALPVAEVLTSDRAINQHQVKSEHPQITSEIIKAEQGTLVVQQTNALTLPKTFSNLVKKIFDFVLPKTLHSNAMLSKHNIQLLLGISIVVTTIGLTSSIYRLIQASSSSAISSEAPLETTNDSLFYKTLAEVPNVPQGIFNYTSGLTFAPLRDPRILSALSQSQRQFQLRFVEPINSPQLSGTAIKMLLDGELSFAQSSRPLKSSELAQAKARGFTLEQIPIAIDGITFFVHPSLSIVGLNLAQLRDIFTGKITNWQAIGGPNLEIVPYTLNPQTSGTADVIQQTLLGGESYKNVKVVDTTSAAIRRVSATPGAIGYGSASVVVKQRTIYPLPLARSKGEMFITPFAGINQTTLNKTALTNGSYPLTRRLFVIVKRDRLLDEQAGIAYANLLLSDEGQKLVEQAGFVPVR